MINLKIKFIPYEKTTGDNFGKLIKDLKKDTIILIDAKLSPAHEAELIKITMEHISEKFAGIELSSIEVMPEKGSASSKIRDFLFQITTGKKRGMTVIGPARIIRKIEKNPQELLVYV
ncbi:MAG: DUF2073 domain-containing protein [Nanoarchaeota archaeon]|nr:DUF2073 domain-containing protein [Nanoarchaeota archaeon]MBU4299824.1 DUF2073 domain-containing protein [Nanoarchaeota archaeon]MBU4451293.1 DUF2073 domain-containing protein [Nanoarchaeota archaeon]MCG2723582.1 DUF2073 domain-containing protein [archaeon]